MSKQGRNRRTKEQRLEARDLRSSRGYLQNLMAQVEKEQAEVSETTEEKK